MQEQTAPPAPEAIAARLGDLAAEGGVGLTPHRVDIDRALAAVAEAQGVLIAPSKRRAVGLAIKYESYLQARKAAMLEVLARAA